MNIVFQLTLPPSTNDDALINVYQLYHRVIRDTIQTNVTDIFPGHEVTVLNITSGFIDIECAVGTVASEESFGCGKMIYVHYGIEKIVFALDSICTIIPFMIKTFLLFICFFCSSCTGDGQFMLSIITNVRDVLCFNHRRVGLRTDSVPVMAYLQTS